jgi:hypothetical protein
LKNFLLLGLARETRSIVKALHVNFEKTYFSWNLRDHP